MKYLAFEGADGTGKTTLAKTFAEKICSEFTYEPNGEGPICEKLREWALQGKWNDIVNWRAREYMLLATRAMSTKNVSDKLEAGFKIVTDRSLVSGMTFAHVASDMSFDSWWKIGEDAFWCFPEIVVYVTTEEQKISVSGDDIYDNAADDFHTKIKKTFPGALNYVCDKLPIKKHYFTNSFDCTPDQNANRLLREISESL